MEKHKTTFDEAILISKVISISRKIDYANCKDFEEYENRRGIIDIDEEEFNFLKNPKLKESRNDNE